MKKYPVQVTVGDLKESMPYYPGKFEMKVDELLKVSVAVSFVSCLSVSSENC